MRQHSCTHPDHRRWPSQVREEVPRSTCRPSDLSLCAGGSRRLPRLATASRKCSKTQPRLTVLNPRKGTWPRSCRTSSKSRCDIARPIRWQASSARLPPNACAFGHVADGNGAVALTATLFLRRRPAANQLEEDLVGCDLPTSVKFPVSTRRMTRECADELMNVQLMLTECVDGRTARWFGPACALMSACF